MLERYAAQFDALGNSVAATLPRGWRKVWLSIEMLPSSESGAIFYTTDRQPTPQQIASVPFDVFEHARALYDATDGERWTELTMIVQHDGHVSVDFGYDPVPIEGGFERRLAWEAKYLGR